MTNLELNELADLLYPNCKPVEYYFNKYKPRNISGEVTRVAPSPTGYLHIGTIYQALCDSFIAKNSGGVFYLRSEDTDGKREVEGAGDIAYNSLVSFGLTPNEGYRGDSLPEIGDYGPYVQSERTQIYHSFAHELVKRGGAFPCFCAATNGKEEILKRREEELEENNDLQVKDPCRNLTLDEIKQKIKEGKTFALRLKSNGDGEQTVEFTDEIMGKKQLRVNAKDDVLIKSNGIPVYSFAHIVDDTLMGTTLNVRGQDWYQSLPVHIELAKAFGFKPFRYAHTPNICVLNEHGNKRKISKRKDTFADARFFLKQGYPVTAVIEYLLNLLNSDFEIWRKNNPTLSYTEFPFEINKIGVTNPMFDFVKLNDVSKEVISRMTAEEVYNNALAWAKEWNEADKQTLEANKQTLIKMLSIDRGGDRPRKDITLYSEIVTLFNYILPNFNPDYQLDIGLTNKQALISFLTEYSNNYTTALDNSMWFGNLKQMASKFNFVDNKTYKQNPSAYAGNIADASKFVRLAITGKTNSPELYSIMKILGETECKTRLNNLIKQINK